MRTTVNLADDVAAAVERLRVEHGLGVSAAINELARAGMVSTTHRPAFQQKSRSLGLRLDVSNIGEVLEYLDDDDR